MSAIGTGIAAGAGEAHGDDRCAMAWWENGMSILDLNSRLTQSWAIYNEKMKDQDSLVYVDGRATTKLDSPITLALSVGSNWLSADDERLYIIPTDGITLKPRQTVVVETEETVAMPCNAFGVVTGKGSYIFRGMLISSGKIDPGFHGRLRIGIYNGSRRSRQLTTGMVIALAYFLRMDFTLPQPMPSYETFSATQAVSVPWTFQVLRWFRANWAVAAPLVMSVISVIVVIWRTSH